MMNQSLKNDIKQMFNTTHMVNKLILVILGASVLYFLVSSILKGFEYNFNINDYLFVGSDLMDLLKHPWVLITHLFIARSLYEMIWLLLLLYWFGSILGDIIGDDKILPVYLFSGILGSVFFLLLTNIIKVDYFYLSGLESSVIGIMVSSAVLVPDYNLNLILFGKIRIKFIVLAIIVIDLLFLYSSSRYQYLAFPGAILAGWYYILGIRAGNGLNVPINKAINGTSGFIGSFFDGRKGNLQIKHKDASVFTGKEDEKKVDQNELNRILDKIRTVGYDNLSESEKQFLFKSGRG